MKKKNETQEKMRTELEKKGWKFYKKSTHAVCPNQLRLTVNDSYMYAYPYMQGIWCNLCVAFGLKENYNLNRRTVDNYIPDGKQSWRLLAVDTINGVRFYEHKLSSRRIDYSNQEKGYFSGFFDSNIIISSIFSKLGKVLCNNFSSLH